MESHLRVEIVPRVVPPTGGEITDATAALADAQESGNVVDVEAAEAALRAVREGRQDGYLARVGDVEVPVRGYAVEPDETGQVLLSLVLAPDSISIGIPPAPAATAPGRAVTPNVGRWGDSTVPDLRERIPGWQPETLSAQVAGHAERVALRQPSPMAWLRRFSGDSSGEAVTA